MNWNDPTPLWLSLGVPLGISATLLTIAGIIWIIQRFRR